MQQMVKTRVIKLRVIEGPEVQTIECWLRTCEACVITTWRLGLRAPLVARKKDLLFYFPLFIYLVT